MLTFIYFNFVSLAHVARRQLWPCLCCILAINSVATVRAEISLLGDNVIANFDPLGNFDGGSIVIGEDDLGGLFYDVAFDPGQILADDLTVGMNPLSYGAVSMDGFPTEIRILNFLTIGDAGTGVVDLFDSATLQVGEKLALPAAQVVDEDGLTTIGAQETGFGQLNMTAIASRLETEDLIVGDLGQGTIIASSRAALNSGNAFIGNADGSNGLVSISDLGTRWTVGTGSITNPPGSFTPKLASLVIGNASGSSNVGIGGPQTGLGQGIVRIANQALVEVSRDVDINRLGRLELETGGRLRVLSSTPLGTSIMNNGVVSGDGFVDFVGSNFLNEINGEIRNSSNAIEGEFGANQREKLIFTGGLLTNNGTIESLGGELEFRVPVFNNFEIVARDAVMRFPQGLFNNGGASMLVLGGETTVHGLVDNTGGGRVELLPSSDIAIIGDLRFSTSSIVSLVIGDNASNLFVSGIADLGNALLDLNYSTGDAPRAGDSYEILRTAGGLAGTMFGNTPVPAGGALWDITYVGNSVFASFGGIAAGPMGADFNGDGIVNGLDIAIWQANFGRTSPPNLDAFGDADSDGDVDGRDFLRIQREFGGPGVEPIIGALASVPEPSAMVLLLSAALGCFVRRRL